ncbi:RluA family pseudouridine synthase [Parvularcula sp. IMCC14364]|uniref:RluA family pseudouridine synthase n=1 Tax=Parvularcula sp. IMCC14364 TaxID=3067902 RepID=UPI0027424C8F|nr:RluA family pseudouridine synthase [Parvularcula sp. IMCC14364]
MTGVRMIEVKAADSEMRLDRWFRQHFPQVRHGDLEKMLRKGNIRVDGAKVKANHRLATGETVRVPPVPERDAAPIQKSEQHISSDDRAFMESLVIYRDRHVLALNKPFGIAVQGGARTSRHIDGLLDALAENGERPRLVHRLDRDTGGLLILGRTRKAAAFLSEAFQRHQVQKEYWALCAGMPHPMEGTIDLPIAKKMVRIGVDEQERMVAADGEEARKAFTDYQVVEEAGGKACFLALRPLTGRTHQLRVHCAAMGHPIVGDGKYGGVRARLEGVSPKMHLACRAMVFPNPAGGRPLNLRAGLTGHMAKSWQFFNFSNEPEIIWPELR